jgi:hypothetical protein
MAKLETQYKNFIKKNPDIKLTYDEWLSELSLSLEEVVNDFDATLMDGLENEPPYVSDNFQIGPDGTFELSDREIDFQNLLKSVSSKLNIVTYNNGDISDLGNEIGMAIAEHIKNITETDINDFISGVIHGINLKKDE